MPRLLHPLRRAIAPLAGLKVRLRLRRPLRATRHRPVHLLHIGVALALTLAAAVAVAGGLLAAVLSWIGWPSKSALTPLTSTTLLELVKIALAVVGGIGGAVALVVAYRKQRLSEDDARREDTKLYADRFDKATEKLGSNAPAVRLAGVHALAALADDWDGGRQMCIDVLCAYLRMPPEPEPDPAQDAAQHATWRAMREVRATIVRLITAHLREHATVSWRGSDLDFTGVVFDHDATFVGVAFSGGRVSFIGAVFSAGAVSFIDAVFSGGTVWFDEAVFSGGEVSFTWAKFTGSQVSFRQAVFSSGEVSFNGAVFSGGAVWFDEGVFSGGEVLFDGAEFSGSQVWFDSVKFAGGEVSFDRALFTGGEVPFDRAEFSGSQVSFNGAEFSGGEVWFEAVANWSYPPTGLPAAAPGLYLPAPSSDAADEPDPDPAPDAVAPPMATEEEEA
ncbi:pentapeptide repeat-containing protein [Microbispora sp. NPDC004025]